MTAPSLAQVFGPNATQTDSILTISKQDLAASGLVASATNTADSLFAAIVANAELYLTTANQQNNDDQNVVINDGIDSLTYKNSISYRSKSKTISFRKVDTATVFNPNDY